MSRTILMIAPYLPVPANFGGALRIFHLIKQLSGQHNVILLAPGDESDLAAAWDLQGTCDVTLVPARSTARDPAGRRKRLTQLASVSSGRSFLEMSSYNPQFQAVIDRLFMTRTIDVVQYEFPESALYALSQPVPAVFDAHNVEHDLLWRIANSTTSDAKRGFNLLEARKLKRLEVRVWNQSTVCVATSERDAGLMRGLTSTPVEIVANGVDLEAFSGVQAIAPKPHNVVFTGAMRYQPNADGAQWYVREVHPLVLRQIPDASVTIAGADPPADVRALASPSVRVTGEVDDIRPYLGNAQAVVVPLWSGGGTRLKILEAFAAGRPVVSTTIGAEGIGAIDGEHLLIADTPESFAAAVIRLFEDDALTTRLGHSVFQFVKEHYGWEHITRKLVDAHDLALDRVR